MSGNLARGAYLNAKMLASLSCRAYRPPRGDSGGGSLRYYVTNASGQEVHVLGEVVADPVIQFPGIPPEENRATDPKEHARRLGGDRIWTLEQIESDPAGKEALRRWRAGDDAIHEASVRARLAETAADTIRRLADRDGSATALVGATFEEQAKYLYDRAVARALIREAFSGP